MFRPFGLLLLVVTLALTAACSSQSGGSDSMKPALKTGAMACCGDACKKMGANCCKIDDMGMMVCSMGGSCCVKTDSKDMGGMNMGK